MKREVEGREGGGVKGRVTQPFFGSYYSEGHATTQGNVYRSYESFVGSMFLRAEWFKNMTQCLMWCSGPCFTQHAATTVQEGNV